MHTDLVLDWMLFSASAVTIPSSAGEGRKEGGWENQLKEKPRKLGTKADTIKWYRTPDPLNKREKIRYTFFFQSPGLLFQANVSKVTVQYNHN